MPYGERAQDKIHPQAKIHATVVFAQGMSLVKSANDLPVHLEHYGAIEILEYAYIGPYTVIHRARKPGSATVIGPSAQIGALNNIGHHAQIGKGCVITQHVSIGGSVSIGEGSYIAPGVVILPHVSIAPKTFIGAGSIVTRSIDTSGGVYYGRPAKRIRSWSGSWRHGEI